MVRRKIRAITLSRRELEHLIVDPDIAIATPEDDECPWSDDTPQEGRGQEFMPATSEEHRARGDLLVKITVQPLDKGGCKLAELGPIGELGEPIFGMDATRISMARLLNYLFEVTERFGMQTRTELILLQRTMVVVEGVARSLNPSINIWHVAQPVVEDYIRTSLGPAAMVRDLMRAARVLGRFGPHLPAAVEAALIRVRQPQAPAPQRRSLAPLAWFLAGIGIGWAGILTVFVLF